MRWIIYITLTVGGILLSSSESQLSVILQKEKKMSDEGRNVIFTCLLVTDKIITSSSISSFELYRDGHLVTSKPMHAVRATTFSVNKASDGSYTCVFRMGQRYSIESAPVTLRDKGETTREPQCADSCQYKLVVNDSGTQDTETTGTDWGWSTGVYIVAGVVASLILVMVGIVIYVMRKQGAKAQLQAAASTPATVNSAKR
ncbi:uncharacterized protein LOC120536186 isoform X2 [Polypterus senegalus]|uniref:uncharacterized protein LOC120536186 isoform X2 n=1 Tax=Polypterus senegalus TaxID=55291 RepID=UPI0019645BF4|nr:uncharacterized protein LOC120536186 isoform X2 [Polypterus senegalus]